MKPLRSACMLSLALLPCLLFSQIRLEGNLRLGDTAQVHVLYTSAGDILIGRVTAFDLESISFLYKNSKPMVFRLEEVEKIVVQESNGSVEQFEQAPAGVPRQKDPGFQYLVRMKSGSDLAGRLVRFSRNSLGLECNGCPARLALQDVSDIELSSGPIFPNIEEAAFRHVLRTGRGDVLVGQLLTYSETDGFLFLLENGDSVALPAALLLSGRLQAVSGGQAVVPAAGGSMEGECQVMFGSTAFQLQQGEVSFRSTILFFHSFDYGLANFLSIGVGASTFGPYPGMSVRMKAGFSLGSWFHLGAGGHAMGIYNNYYSGDSNTWQSALAATASLTLGTRDRYVNFGVMRGKENVEEEFQPVSSGTFTGFTVGGAYRVTQKLRFFAEHFQTNWKDPQTPDFSSLGLSILLAKHRIDAGLSAVTNQDSDLLVFPVAGYSVRF